MSVFPGSRDSFCHRFWTACSSCGHNLQCFWGKLLQRCVQPSYLPVDAALNLLLSANIAAALTALISGPNSSNQTILNFCCICLCLTFAGFSFPIVARNYSKLSLFCTWLFVCFQSNMVEILVLVEVLICRIDDYKVICSPEVTEEASTPKE